MASPPGLPGAAAWRQEAEAVVADIAPHVSAAALSSLSGDAAGALLNVTTLEGRRLTVRLTGAGFSVCGEGHDCPSHEGEGHDSSSHRGEGHDSCPSHRGEGHDSSSGVTGGEEGSRVYETPYALLHDLSPAYTAAFSQSLADRLGELANGAVDEDDGEEGDEDGGEEGDEDDGEEGDEEGGEGDRPGAEGKECERTEEPLAVHASAPDAT